MCRGPESKGAAGTPRQTIVQGGQAPKDMTHESKHVAVNCAALLATPLRRALPSRASAAAVPALRRGPAPPRLRGSSHAAGQPRVLAQRTRPAPPAHHPHSACLGLAAHAEYSAYHLRSARWKSGFRQPRGTSAGFPCVLHAPRPSAPLLAATPGCLPPRPAWCGGSRRGGGTWSRSCIQEHTPPAGPAHGWDTCSGKSAGPPAVTRGGAACMQPPEEVAFSTSPKVSKLALHK